jgi:hypothetical protein
MSFVGHKGAIIIGKTALFEPSLEDSARFILN